MDKIQCLTKVKRVSARHHLCQRYGYRCISPSGENQGLDSFYGPDRSFCLGLMFDDTDFVIEFIGRQPQPQQQAQQQAQRIAHHCSSFRGRIEADNTRILAVYFRKNPIDYPKRDFFKHLKKLCQQVPIGTIFYQYSSCDEVATTTTTTSSSIVGLKSVWKKILL